MCSGTDHPASGPVDAPVVGLLSFALAHRIESQHDKALQSQVGRESLAFRLPFLCVAGLQKDSGIAAGLVGPVEIGGDVEPRQALEDHLLDDVALGLNAAGDFGIQRAAVVGQTAEQRQHRLADRLFPALGIGDIVDIGNGGFPPLELLLRDLIHPPQEGVVERAVERRATVA